MKPKMILFDYGQTLIVEPQFDTKLANLAVLQHASGHTDLSPEEICAFAEELFDLLSKKVREDCREIDNLKFQRLLYEYLGLTLDISYEEADLLFWDTATHGSFASPGAEETLSYLHMHGIRTGVVSNLCFSQNSLKTRIDRYLPNNHLEFIIASSSYIFRKPETILFEIALRRAKLEAKDVWFCGDNPTADILGAHNAGIHPVLYTGAHKRDFRNLPKLSFDQIDSLTDLIALIENT